MTEENLIFNPTMKHGKQALKTDETGQRTEQNREHLHQNWTNELINQQQVNWTKQMRHNELLTVMSSIIFDSIIVTVNLSKNLLHNVK